MRLQEGSRACRQQTGGGGGGPDPGETSPYQLHQQRSFDDVPEIGGAGARIFNQGQKLATIAAPPLARVEPEPPCDQPLHVRYYVSRSIVRRNGAGVKCDGKQSAGLSGL